MAARAFKSRKAQDGFRDELALLLRAGRADEALDKAREKLGKMTDSPAELVNPAMSTEPGDLELVGWNDLDARLRSFDSRGVAITAIALEFARSDARPDADGLLEPAIETTYFRDLPAVEFSRADREELGQACLDKEPAWHHAFEDIDNLIEVKGLGKLYGALALRADTCRKNTSAGDLYLLAACICATLMHLAVRQAVRKHGLPRPLALMVGSNGQFPHLDAPAHSLIEIEELLFPAAVEDDDSAEDKAARERAIPCFEEDNPSGTELRRRYVDPDSAAWDEPTKRGAWAMMLGFLRPA